MTSVDTGVWSGLDGRPCGTGGIANFDLARLRLLRDRNRQPQDPAVVAGLDAVQIQVVAQDQLSAEPATRSLGGEYLPVPVSRYPLGADSEHVALDVEVDGLGRDAGQVELDDE